MRRTGVLGASIAVAAALAAMACGDEGDQSVFVEEGTPDATTPIAPCLTCDASIGDASYLQIEEMRIEPADGVLIVQPDQAATLAFKVFARMKGQTQEEDITARSRFYTASGWEVGTFPATGENVFTSLVPKSIADPPQRGGKVVVQATAASLDGSYTQVRTSLTVKIAATSIAQPGASPPIPGNPAGKFAGALDATAGRAPRIVYPNDGVMLPPNVRRLDVHFDAGTGNDLFELTFTGPNSTITYYARCTGGTGYVTGACGFELDQRAYAFIGQTNHGAPVTLKIRGTTEATPATYGESTPITLRFAEQDVAGGIYYWTVTSPPRVMRVDFGNPKSTPEAFLEPGVNGLAPLDQYAPDTENCVGCHTLSRAGDKLVASVGGQWDGRLLFLNDLSKDAGVDSGWLTQNGAATGAPAENRVQFASFNPVGSQFVAVYGDDPDAGKDKYLPSLLPPDSGVPADLDRFKLWFHDGMTGLRVANKQLAFKPSHPDWAPDGQSIAFTHVGDDDTTTQRPRNASIDVIKLDPNTNVWGDPIEIVPADVANGKSRYNPSFAPDSTFFAFTESVCSGAFGPDAGDLSGSACDGDADTTGTTWVVKPASGATRIQLAKADAPGIADAPGVPTGNTFPRSSPWVNPEGKGRLMWFTVASRRAPGLRTKGGAQLLWMFAVDPDKVLAGQDGSYPAFVLPFQDFTTSNHIAQWTEAIVGSNAPPVPPPPPPPPPPPVPR